MTSHMLHARNLQEGKCADPLFYYHKVILHDCHPKLRLSYKNRNKSSWFIIDTGSIPSLQNCVVVNASVPELLWENLACVI